MSYDLVVCAKALDKSDLRSWKIVEETGESSPVEREKLEEFLEILLSKYPAVERDGSNSEFWSSVPELEPRNNGMVLNASNSKAHSMLPDIIEIARKVQVSVFDYQANRIYRPDGFMGITLEVENQANYISPTKSQIAEVVNELTAKTGPSLLFMERKGSQDYAQVAGGDGMFTAEWREYQGKDFKHYAAGLKTGSKNEEVKIHTNGFYVTVMENERLGVLETEHILTAFAEGKIRPSEYEWRDITSKFDSGK
ncbi:MAG: hypothetical protein K2X81_04765 [Candidatus Obscuribacterales bacterium]|nr:hypothetical protein [Candidatus Obscuribacterales bacterium]